MKPSNQTRPTCRLCGAKELVAALSLKPSPIGDNYRETTRAARDEVVYDLTVMRCEKCGQVQLAEVIDPAVLYTAFPYVTSISTGLPEHFRRFALDVVNRRKITSGSLVVEIGSNEGPMLRAFKEQGCRVLGIEPASAIAKLATDSGVPTWGEFFNAALAEKIFREVGPARVIAANNVLANIDDLDDVFRGFARLLTPDGIVVMESSYWGNVVQSGLIDTVYHEHISYFSATPLAAFFKKHGLELVAVEWISNKGGSLRLTIQKQNGPWPVEPSVAEFIERERASRLHTAEPGLRCRQHLDASTAKLQSTLKEAKDAGRKIIGWGASVGTTTMVQEFGLAGLIDFFVDDNPRKHGRFAPGSGIVCHPAEALWQESDAAVVMFAWRFLDNIFSHHPRLKSYSGRIILPLPEPTVR